MRLTVPLFLAAGAAVVTAAPAAADGCNHWYADWGSTYTWVYNPDEAPRCNSVDARIDRYYASQVYVYTSGPYYNFASISAYEGVNAGNAGRGYSGSGSWPGWTWL